MSKIRQIPVKSRIVSVASYSVRLNEESLEEAIQRLTAAADKALDTLPDGATIELTVTARLPEAEREAA